VPAPNSGFVAVARGWWHSLGLRVTQDCNSNGIDDPADIAGGTSADCNANGIPDECENCADLDGDGVVDARDYQFFRESYGRAVGDPAYDMCADYDGSGAVGLGDFQAWLGCYRDFVGNPLAGPPVDDDDDQVGQSIRPQPLGHAVETNIKPDQLAIPDP
jgi:hypothetical protein